MCAIYTRLQKGACLQSPTSSSLEINFMHELNEKECRLVNWPISQHREFLKEGT